MGARNASRSLHLAFLANILHCPMNFFDVTPLGRIVNRFSKDVDTIDVVVPLNAHMFLMCFLHVISTIIVISMGTPLFLSVIVPLMILYYFVQVHLEPYNLVSSFLFLWRVHFFCILHHPGSFYNTFKTCQGVKIFVLFVRGFCCGFFWKQNNIFL